MQECHDRTRTGRRTAVVLLAALAVGAAGAVFPALATSARAAPPEAYRKAWSDPALVKRIDENIEHYRKKDAVVEVVDAAGAPVAGAEVTVTQKTHEFLFGCNLFVLGQLDTPELNRKYEGAFANLFNFATIPFYWAGTEPVQGQLRYAEGAPRIWRRPPPDRLVKWCKAQGITAKGHPLLWHAHNPPWIPRDADELKRLYVKRFGEIAARYAADVKIWDVVNESLVCPKSYPLFSEDRSYVAWAFGQTHKVFRPDDLLMINEVSSVSHEPIEGNRYYKQVKGLVDRGTGVEGIGFQFHFFTRKALDDSFFNNPNYLPSRMADVYEKFGDFDRPLFITEITIPGAGDDGPAVQAEVVANLYRLWFSVPRMAGITWWNLGDGTAIERENVAQAGFVDQNMDPKPVYRALEQLIHHDWTTRLAAKTDASGRLEFRGFLGDYDVSVETAEGRGSARFRLARDAAGPWKLPLKQKDAKQP